MNYSEELNYLLENDLQYEEFCFLKALYHLEENNLVHMNQKAHAKLHANIKRYYTQRKLPWVDMINNLIKKGFIVDYRKDKEKDPNSIDTSKIKLLGKFKDTFFVDKEVAYEEAKAVYPSKMFNGRETMYGRHETLKDYYFSNVISNGSKAEHARFIEITKQKFDFDERVINERGDQKGALKSADVGWQTYLESFKDIARQFERDQAEGGEDNWYTTIL